MFEIAVSCEHSTGIKFFVVKDEPQSLRVDPPCEVYMNIWPEKTSLLGIINLQTKKDILNISKKNPKDS